MYRPFRDSYAKAQEKPVAPKSVVAHKPPPAPKAASWHGTVVSVEESDNPYNEPDFEPDLNRRWDPAELRAAFSQAEYSESVQEAVAAYKKVVDAARPKSLNSKP